MNIFLTESGTFTDQIFEGSNLSILNNLFAFNYEETMFYLNNTASEGMFTDAQFYEDMNRIVKVFGYKPRGFVTSMTEVSLSANSSDVGALTQSFLFPKYLNFQVGNYSYTTSDDLNITVANGAIVDDVKMILHNGTWQLYDAIPTAIGIPFETIVLSNLVLTNQDALIYLAHPFIDVYVQEAKTGNFTKYDRVIDLYDYSSTDKIYEIRLNENKQYELKFGDGIFGSKLGIGDQLYIIWLRSDGPDGKIAANALNVAFTDTPSIDVKVNGLTTEFVRNTLLGASGTDLTYLTTDPVATVNLGSFFYTNDEASSEVANFETVDEIRASAPSSFRMQNRLVTARDYEQFILNNHIGNHEILDVAVQSNKEYLRDFQQWLYSYNKLSPEITYYSYRYSDTCDFNNVYIWLKSSNKSGSPVSYNTKDIVQRDTEKLKNMTAEVVIMDPILVAFAPYNPEAGVPTWAELTTTSFFDQHKILIIRNKNSLVSIESIKRKAYQVITNFFDVSNNKLGVNVDIGALYGQLLAINGVREIQTVKFKSSTDTTPTMIFPGLSFGIWTSAILRGADFKTSNGSAALKSFQFPFLFEPSKLLNRIIVGSENFKLNNVEY